MIILFPLVVLAKEVWTIPVMNCQGCEEKIQTVIDELKISDQVELIDYKSRTVCFQVAPSEEISKKLEAELKAQKYIVSEKRVMDSCLQEIREPWEDTRGDFQIISKGQRVSIKKHRVYAPYAAEIQEENIPPPHPQHPPAITICSHTGAQNFPKRGRSWERGEALPPERRWRGGTAHFL